MVEQIETYGEGHQDTFAGAWFGYRERDHLYVFAAFVGDLERHRAALDPRVRLVTATRSLAGLDATLEAVRSFAASVGLLRVHADVDREDERVVLIAAAEDPQGFATSLRAQFGEVVDAYIDLRGRRAKEIERWTVRSDGRTIDASWMGGADDDEPRLDAEVSGAEIRLTASTMTGIGVQRIAGGSGPEVMWGVAAMGLPLRASATLDEPVEGRRIVDSQARRR